MEELVVVTFYDKQKAAEGLSRLKELGQLDEITIYELALIHKQANNHVEVILHEQPEDGITAIIVALIYVVSQSVVGNVITPLVQKRMINLPPALTLSARY
jgi:hypothetical protein